MKDNDVKKLIATIFTNPSSWKLSQPPAIRPNRLAYNKDARIGVVVVYQGDGQDYALGQASLESVLNAEKDGRITEGYVSLWELPNGGSPKFVAAERATVVRDNLRGVDLREGKFGWGDYRWITADFKPAPSWSSRLSPEEPW